MKIEQNAGLGNGVKQIYDHHHQSRARCAQMPLRQPINWQPTGRIKQCLYNE